MTPNSDRSAAAEPETQTETTVAVVNGQPSNGFREVLNISNSELAGCDEPSAAAVSPDIYNCYPSAAGADLCWPAPPGSMLCLDDPWAKGLRRFDFDTAYLTAVQPPSSPRPFALLLDDDTRCRLISGGARGDRPDGYLPAYNCGTAGSTLAVLKGPNATDPIDRSAPVWTVQVAPLGPRHKHVRLPQPGSRELSATGVCLISRGLGRPKTSPANKSQNRRVTRVSKVSRDWPR
jgi:serine/threonine-protein kinase